MHHLQGMTCCDAAYREVHARSIPRGFESSPHALTTRVAASSFKAWTACSQAGPARGAERAQRSCIRIPS